MLEKMKDAVSSRIPPTREHWSGLRDDLRGRLRGLRNNREAGQQKELEADFTRLLAAWGIEEETAIPGIITDLQIRCLILATPVLLAAVLTVLAQSVAAFLSLVFITPPCLFGFLTTLRRISVLERRAFTPLCRWLVNGLTRSVPETLSRILNVFPHEEHLQVAATLLSSLRLIISQRLFSHPCGKGRTALREYLAFTPQIREKLLDTPSERLIQKTEELLEAHGRKMQDSATKAFEAGNLGRDAYLAILAERKQQTYEEMLFEESNARSGQ